MKEQDDILTTPTADSADSVQLTFTNDIGEGADSVLPQAEEPDEPAPAADDEAPSLKQVIRDTAVEEEKPNANQFTLRKILGGDILNTRQVKSQVWLILLIAIFLLVYVGNRYGCQKAQIEIARLEQELTDIQKKTLSKSSELTELSRETNVLRQLKANNDTTLKSLEQPPYYIEVE